MTIYIKEKHYNGGGQLDRFNFISTGVRSYPSLSFDRSFLQTYRTLRPKPKSGKSDTHFDFVLSKIEHEIAHYQPATTRVLVTKDLSFTNCKGLNISIRYKVKHCRLASVRVMYICKGCFYGHHHMGDIDMSYFASTFSEKHEELKDWSHIAISHFQTSFFIFTLSSIFIYFLLLHFYFHNVAYLPFIVKVFHFSCTSILLLKRKHFSWT